jgi:hypothetical protein
VSRLGVDDSIADADRGAAPPTKILGKGMAIDSAYHVAANLETLFRPTADERAHLLLGDIVEALSHQVDNFMPRRKPSRSIVKGYSLGL